MSINRQNLAINQKIFETVAIAGLNGGSRWVRGALGRKVWLSLGVSQDMVIFSCLVGLQNGKIWLFLAINRQNLVKKRKGFKSGSKWWPLLRKTVVFVGRGSRGAK